MCVCVCVGDVLTYCALFRLLYTVCPSLPRTAFLPVLPPFPMPYRRWAREGLEPKPHQTLNPKPYTPTPIGDGPAKVWRRTHVLC